MISKLSSFLGGAGFFSLWVKNIVERIPIASKETGSIVIAGFAFTLLLEQIKKLRSTNLGWDIFLNKIRGHSIAMPPTILGVAIQFNSNNRAG
ncbi:hypothetical protein [Oscillatoria sp. FACHB-1406]|uniref:hypothetical protein n=1 Tax=Oscillatoria sp. FACHB-1406 TaxID=2692846 RepID=UPI001685B76C|nr:hypothetical protein [Oscillatoria sp. FACHB-1406]MBD2579924.1 hypothetical protein [Oscillatoria sp. FACHB-1406]